MRRGPKSGHSYFVERDERPGDPGHAPTLGRATSPERARRLVARYIGAPAPEGTRVTVTGSNGARWPTWEYVQGKWMRFAPPRP